MHYPLIDVLLRFRSHCVALTTGVSKMYRAVELVLPNRNLHRFVQRKSPDELRMTRVIFGVCTSYFAANMAKYEVHTGIPSSIKGILKVILCR